jgi:hypothetical protein
LPDDIWLLKIDESMSENPDETSNTKRSLTLLRQICS